MKKSLILLLSLACLIGCTSFSNHVFRAEQAAVTLAYGAYIGYTNALPTLNLTPQQSNAVKQARLHFAASVSVLDSWRVSYETNSTVKPQVEAALTAVSANSSNLIWLITYIKNGGQP